MKKYLLKNIGIFCCVAIVLSLFSACGEKRKGMSKALYIINDTDVTVTSLLLDVEKKPLDVPIELLDYSLVPGSYQEVIISLPEKQAKNGEWTALAITEEGAEHSKPFAVGDMNPHGDRPVQGFYVTWFGDGSQGHYSVGASFLKLEEFLQSHFNENSDTVADQTSDNEAAEDNDLDAYATLITGERFIVNGNPNHGNIVFFENHTVYFETVGGDVEGVYYILDEEIYCDFADDDESGEIVFLIIDEDILSWDNGDDEPILLIREGSR